MLNTSPEEGVIRVYGRIGKVIDASGHSSGISGSDFAAEMAHLQNICNKISIRYNSMGGSVVDGYSMYSSIVNCKVPTTSYIDGLAASTAGWCALAANKVVMSDIASFMIHGASGEPAEMVSLANGSIAKMLSNRSGMTLEETTDLMTKETFYRAFDPKDKAMLLDKKIVDEITSTGKKIKINKSESLENVANQYDKILKPKNMSNINTLLNISKNADESEQEVAITTLKNELAETKTKLADLEKEKTEKEAADKAALKSKAETLVNQAEKDKKILTAERASYLEQASASQSGFDFVSNVFSKLPSGKDAAKIFDVKNIKTHTGTEDRSTWTYKDWEQKDEAGLVNMYKNDPEAYKQLRTTLK